MAFIPQYPGLFAMYNQPQTFPDFRSRPQVCGCETCVDLRANGYTNLHHAYDDDDERGQCRYCPPRDPRNLSEAEALEHRRRWRRQAFIDVLKAEAEANGGAGEPQQLVYELRSLREEISHLSDLVYSVMLDEDCDCDECDDYSDDDDDDDCCPGCCPDCASAGPADVEKQEQEEVKGKGGGEGGPAAART
ncbi:hypothetical protein PG993_012867 [Apiospora rasikravindrae]|uniref:Uncharacterized protein n=1 Tax=Apiospora rasikravindrae TaxID=990691 RepID=A0ABR1RXA5_9PEZI